MALDACGLVVLAAGPASAELPLTAREDELIAEMETLGATPVTLEIEPLPSPTSRRRCATRSWSTTSP